MRISGEKPVLWKSEMQREKGATASGVCAGAKQITCPFTNGSPQVQQVATALGNSAAFVADLLCPIRWKAKIFKATGERECNKASATDFHRKTGSMPAITLAVYQQRQIAVVLVGMIIRNPVF